MVDNFEFLNIDQHAARDKWGQGVNAYILDSGIAEIDQFPRVQRLPACVSFVSDPKPMKADHGTKVASLIGSRDRGVAPGVTLHDVTVASSSLKNRESAEFTAADVLKGLEWVRDNVQKPAVVCISLLLAPAPQDQYTDERICSTIRDLLSNNVPVVVGAGNGLKPPGNDMYKITGKPVVGNNLFADMAAKSDVISVGAMYKPGFADSQWVFANFSYTGSPKVISIWAPGVEVPSFSFDTTRDDREVSKEALFDGTSAACPQVAGLVAIHLALAQQNGKELSVAQVKAKLLKDARDVELDEDEVADYGLEADDGGAKQNVRHKAACLRL
eukprot:TRINITY_DN112147_c0_g1_i1.p1 TRINITY_DN112147_c0_g1~~TRINITY_DN112147_c0_g1_i1.p1  ORF type:complete len:329 (-),score=68.30 TRINITY_DN112147_c0_g1_i1:102-1088(-)